jgi:pheromone a factor receptor
MSQLPIIILSGLLVVLNSGPMYWQVKQGNSGAISMGVWVIVENLLDFVSPRTCGLIARC